MYSCRFLCTTNSYDLKWCVLCDIDTNIVCAI